ncbi:MAG TPA: LytTR family DNA-binding domain-containing protein [Bacteroidia bacterium]|nr:LytTR family DNA-binding domain-containing protein [Bacteroidia bacterium]
MVSKNLLSIVLVLVVAVFYGNTLRNEFALDDLIVLTGNKFTQQGFAGIPDLLTHDAFVGAYGEALNLSGGRYRPFSMVMFAIEKEIFGYTPVVFHFFNVEKKQVKVFEDDILFIESLKDYVRIHTSKRIFITKFQIGEIEKILTHENFIRIHKSYIVNSNMITSFNAQEIEIDDISLPLGRSYKVIVERKLKG